MPIAPNRLILFLVVHNINKANKVGMTKTLHEGDFSFNLFERSGHDHLISRTTPRLLHLQKGSREHFHGLVVRIHRSADEDLALVIHGSLTFVHLAEAALSEFLEDLVFAWHTLERAVNDIHYSHWLVHFVKRIHGNRINVAHVFWYPHVQRNT